MDTLGPGRIKPPEEIREIEELKQRVAFYESRLAWQERLLEILRENTERYRTVLSGLPVHIYQQDRQLRYTWFFNPPPNFDWECALGKTDEELLPVREAACLTEIKSRVIRTGIKAREIVRGTLGGRAWFYELHIEPMRDQSGTVTGIMCAALDMTVWGPAREVFSDSLKQWLFKIINLIPHPVGVMSMDDFRFHAVNDSFIDITGYSREEVVGRTESQLNIFLNPEDRKEFSRVSVSREKFKNFLLKYQGRSARARTGLFSCQRILVEGRAFLLVMVNDITHLERMEKEITNLDSLRVVGEIAASVGHEIRNPITTVCGMLQLLRGKEECPKKVSHYNLMLEEMDRVSLIISEFLSMARSREAEMCISDLNQVVKTILPLLEADAVKDCCNIRLEPGPVPVVLLDEKEIRQLILNLVRNGLEATEPGGTVTISTFKDAGEAVLAVQDQGKGIEPAVLDKLGTPFFTTKEGGTGLGLTICYSIAARHGASIKVATGPGGSTFEARFKPAE